MIFFTIHILSFRDSLDKLVKMGCKMSKQLKSKKLFSRKSGKGALSIRTTSEAAFELVESEPQSHVKSHAIEDSLNRTVSVDPQTESSSTRVEVTSELVPPDHEMCHGTESGNSSDPGLKGLLPSLAKPANKEAAFDDEILAALAEADAEARLREEMAFGAIIKSMSM